MQNSENSCWAALVFRERAAQGALAGNVVSGRRAFREMHAGEHAKPGKSGPSERICGKVEAEGPPRGKSKLNRWIGH
jgi:hypothetical protein